METAACKYVCNCLNVAIHFEHETDRLDGDYQQHLTDEEKQSDFFQELPLFVVQRCVVSEQHTALVQLIVIGSWIVHKCTHCSMYTHATKCDESTKVVFINSSLKKLTDEESEVLKNGPEFSPVFQILVTDLLHPTIENVTTSHITSETSNAISELKGLLNEKLEERKKSTDEMIRRFVMEQEDALKRFIKRANEDFQSVKIAVMSHCTSETKMSTKNVPSKANVDDSVINDSNMSASPTKAEQEIKGRNPSFDSEGFFPFDETEDNNVLEDDDHSEEDLSDTDDSGSRDEGIYIPRRRSGAAIARSLPIRVQADFGSRYDDNNRAKPNHYNRKARLERPVDIAASMRALAKSVHGDTVFGDLPPPRIGSRI